MRIFGRPSGPTRRVVEPGRPSRLPVYPMTAPRHDSISPRAVHLQSHPTNRVRAQARERTSGSWVQTERHCRRHKPTSQSTVTTRQLLLHPLPSPLHPLNSTPPRYHPLGHEATASLALPHRHERTGRHQSNMPSHPPFPFHHHHHPHSHRIPPPRHRLPILQALACPTHHYHYHCPPLRRSSHPPPRACPGDRSTRHRSTQSGRSPH